MPSVYFNPGDSLLNEDDLGKGGSIARNPLIMQTFHRIKLSDRAGSGLRDVYNSWQKLDRPQPQVINDKARKTFQITLGKKVTFTTALQEAIKARIGIELSTSQATVFAHCIVAPISINSLADDTSLTVWDIYPIIDYLTRQGLIVGQPEGYQAKPHFAEHLKKMALETVQAEKVTKKAEKVTKQTGKVTKKAEKVTKQTGKVTKKAEKVTKQTGKVTKKAEKVTKQTEKSDQVPTESPQKVTKLELTEVQVAEWAKSLNEKKKAKQKALILMLDGPASMTQIVEMLGIGHRTMFKNNHLQKMIDAGLVAETYPDNPRHRNQTYYLTEPGKAVRQMLGQEG